MGPRFFTEPWLPVAFGSNKSVWCFICSNTYKQLASVITHESLFIYLFFFFDKFNVLNKSFLHEKLLCQEIIICDQLIIEIFYTFVVRSGDSSKSSANFFLFFATGF